MDKSSKVVSSVFVIMVFTVGSKILGFLRDVLIAAKFGSGMETDAYFIALSASSVLGTILLQSINTTLIPVLSEVEEEKGKAAKLAHTNNILNLVIVSSLVLLVAGLIFAPWITRIMAIAFEGEQMVLAVQLTRLGMPMILFSGVSAVFLGLLQSEHRFFETAAIQIPFNFVYIFYLVFLAGVFGIRGLIVTSVLAVASQVLLQRIGLRRIQYRYVARIDIHDKYVRKTIGLIPPVLLSVAIGNLNVIVDRSMASLLPEGSISALNFADKLNGLVHGVFVVALATVIFPILSEQARKPEKEGFKQVTRLGVNVILLITIPATAGLIALSEPIVRLAFERGAFDAAASLRTAESLVFYSIGLSGLSLKVFLDKAFFSLQDTRTPMIFSAVLVGIKIGLSVLLIQTMQHRGLALATSLALLSTTSLLLLMLRRKLGPMGYRKVFLCGGKALVSSAVMVAVSLFSYSRVVQMLGIGRIAEAAALFAAVVAGALVYLLLIYLLRVEELRWMAERLRARFRRG